MRIVYKKENNEVGILIPAPKFIESLMEAMSEEEAMIHIADKDLLTGTPYEVVSKDEVPSDRTFRNAWEYVAGSNEKVSVDLSEDYQIKYNLKKVEDDTNQ